MTSSRNSLAALIGVVALAACSGTTGTTGATGAAGAQGTQGIQGIQGIQGPSGLVSTTYVSASPDLATLPNFIVPRAVPTTPSCDGVKGMIFMAGHADVALDAGQRIIATAVIDLAGPGVRAENLTLDICYQEVDQAGTPAGDFHAPGQFLGDTDGGQPLQVEAGTRMPITLTRSLDEAPALAVAANMYRVGLCGCVDAVTANNNDWVANFSWLTVQVVRVPQP